MNLTIMQTTFNSYGCSVVFEPLVALVYLEAKNFGAALSEITLSLYFDCSLPFEQQNVNRSLRQSYDKFHDRSAAPKRVFKRKKAELEIYATVDFISSEDVSPKSKDEYKIRNETYFRDWNLRLLELLKAEMAASKGKFKKTDDFDFNACMAWLNALTEKLPSTKKEADILVEAYKQHRAIERSKLSDWELLGKDWSDYHITAREVVPYPELWSAVDDFAPNGNDTGADVIHFFKQKKSSIQKSKDKGEAIFLREWQAMWGETIPDTNKDYDDLVLNDYRKFTVGYAFSFLKYLGICPEWLKADALKHIRGHEAFIEEQYSNEEYIAGLRAMNKRIVSCLEKAPS